MKQIFLNSGTYTYKPLKGKLDMEKYILSVLEKDTCCTKTIFADEATITSLTTTTFSGTSLTSTGAIYLANGTVSLPSLSFTSDTDSGIYRIGANNIGIGVNAANVLNIATTGVTVTGAVSVDTISEKTSAAGVTIDGALIKDAGISANSMFAGFFPTTAAQALSGAGTVNVTAYLTKYTSTGAAQALSLGSGSQIGQRKKVAHVVDGGSGVMTAVYVGGTTITFTTVGEFADLIWTGSAWGVLELGNSATPGTPPALA